MKAAIIHQFGDTPRVVDFAEPIAGDDEILVDVKAVVLENFEKAVANGEHYSSKSAYPQFPAIVGNRGIGMTPDGKLVGFGMARPPYGAFAEKATVKRFVSIPDGIDPALAAAVPPSALTSLLPLKHTAKIEKGETVLINGATGVSGRLAIQVARLMGAGRIIGTGRNETSLRLLESLGADAIVDLKQSDEALLENFENEKAHGGYDIVIDFLWGRPAEVLMKSFIPKDMRLPSKRTRYLPVGSKAGASACLTGDMFRTSGLEISGMAKVTPEEIVAASNQVWTWIKENRLQMDIEKVPLKEIENAWLRNDLAGKRLVIIP